MMLFASLFIITSSFIIISTSTNVGASIYYEKPSMARLAAATHLPPACKYQNKKYQHGERVVTPEPCLNCTCKKGVLLCFLRVCPTLMAPLGETCETVRESGQCCPVLKCETPTTLATVNATTPQPTTAQMESDTQSGKPENVPTTGKPLKESTSQPGQAEGFWVPSQHDHHGTTKLVQSGVKHDSRVTVKHRDQVTTIFQTSPATSFQDSHLLVTSSPTTNASSDDQHEDLINNIQGGCVINGTIYAEGSAVLSTSFCEYCYCIRSKRMCIRPRCHLSIMGCLPRYTSEYACCPTSYVCGELALTTLPLTTTTTLSTTTTTVPPSSSRSTLAFARKTACTVHGRAYRVGEAIPSDEDCKQCICGEGGVKICQRITCVQAMEGCQPIVPEGHCCPIEYKCNSSLPQKPRSDDQFDATTAIIDSVRRTLLPISDEVATDAVTSKPEKLEAGENLTLLYADNKKIESDPYLSEDVEVTTARQQVVQQPTTLQPILNDVFDLARNELEVNRDVLDETNSSSSVDLRPTAESLSLTTLTSSSEDSFKVDNFVVDKPTTKLAPPPSSTPATASASTTPATSSPLSAATSTTPATTSQTSSSVFTHPKVSTSSSASEESTALKVLSSNHRLQEKISQNDSNLTLSNLIPAYKREDDYYGFGNGTYQKDNVDIILEEIINALERNIQSSLPAEPRDPNKASQNHGIYYQNRPPTHFHSSHSQKGELPKMPFPHYQQQPHPYYHQPPHPGSGFTQTIKFTHENAKVDGDKIHSSTTNLQSRSPIGQNKKGVSSSILIDGGTEEASGGVEIITAKTPFHDLANSDQPNKDGQKMGDSILISITPSSLKVGSSIKSDENNNNNNNNNKNINNNHRNNNNNNKEIRLEVVVAHQNAHQRPLPAFSANKQPQNMHVLESLQKLHQTIQNNQRLTTPIKPIVDQKPYNHWHTKLLTQQNKNPHPIDHSFKPIVNPDSLYYTSDPIKRSDVDVEEEPEEDLEKKPRLEIPLRLINPQRFDPIRGHMPMDPTRFDPTRLGQIEPVRMNPNRMPEQPVHDPPRIDPTRIDPLRMKGNLIPFMIQDAVNQGVLNAQSLSKRNGSFAIRLPAQPPKQMSQPKNPQQTTCLFNGQEYQNGAMIPKQDPCALCRCFYGRELCQEQKCPAPPDRDCVPEKMQGYCCPRYICRVSDESKLPSGAIVNITAKPEILKIDHLKNDKLKGDQIKVEPIDHELSLSLKASGVQPPMRKGPQFSTPQPQGAPSSGNLTNFNMDKVNITEMLPSEDISLFEESNKDEKEKFYQMFPEFPGVPSHVHGFQNKYPPFPLDPLDPRSTMKPPLVGFNPNFEGPISPNNRIHFPIDKHPPRGTESIGTLIPSKPRPSPNRGQSTTFRIKPPQTFGQQPPEQPSLNMNRPPLRLPPFLLHTRPNPGPISIRTKSTTEKTTEVVEPEIIKSEAEEDVSGKDKASTEIPISTSTANVSTSTVAFSSTSLPSETPQQTTVSVTTSTTTHAPPVYSHKTTGSTPPSTSATMPKLTRRTTVASDKHPAKFDSTTPSVPFEKVKAASVKANPWDLLKVSGCNIYGTFYNVEEQIEQLSSACKKCICTSMGVKCNSLC